MYNKSQLDKKSLEELKTIAKELKLTKISKLKKQELIYKVLDYQAANPAKETIEKEQTKSAKPTKRARLKPKPVAESNLNSSKTTATEPKNEVKKAEVKKTRKQVEKPIKDNNIDDIEISELVLPDIPNIPNVEDVKIGRAHV